MINTSNLKIDLIKHFSEILNKKIEILQLAIAAGKESRNSETKSSAGDKYETGRAMIQMEIEKNEVQLNKTKYIKSEFSSINVTPKSEKVEFGSLVFTNSGNYLISFALGKVHFNDSVFFAISLASPLGSVFENRRIGDKIQFQENHFIIKNIL